MKVLVTGHRGRLGVPVMARLQTGGHQVRGFDAADGGDVLDLEALTAAAEGIDAIVHLAGSADDRRAAPHHVMAVNLLGTFHVLQAARANGAQRVVYASSGKALGMLERDPEYLPVDDAHPGLPTRPYGLSKWLSEQMCEAFTVETGIPTICLRPVLVLDEAGWERMGDVAELPPASGPSWHLGAFVDVGDVADAVALSLEDTVSGHVRALLCAAEVGSDRPAAALVAEHLPEVPWKGQPYPVDARTALVSCSVARCELGWVPRHGWPAADRGTVDLER